jgi:hypothetical protein
MPCKLTRNAQVFELVSRSNTDFPDRILQPRRISTTTFEAAPRFAHRLCFVLFMFLLVPFSAYPQVMLTGAIQFSTNSTGATYGGLLWNTLGGDSYYDLWLAQNPDATSPVNGPSDTQAGISIPLQAGNTYTYYIFGQPGPGLVTGFNGLNLFFDGDNSVPGISVFGATNGSGFQQNGSSTFTLQGTPVAGSGERFYSSGGVTVVQSGYDWNAPATPPGDVCQAFVFSPGDEADYFGSFTLQVWPAATLSLSQTGGPPGTELTTTGSGFAPTETVAIYVNHIGGAPLLIASADASGAFAINTREPQIPYGPIDFFAVGLTSGRLGAATFSVTAAMVMIPNAGAPGDALTAVGVGFGAGETVDIYWAEPRQLLGTATANAQGTRTLKITIPANAPRGPNGVLGVGQTTNATGFGEVVVK